MQKKYLPKKNLLTGFTLVELVTVLVILAILVSIALPTYTASRRKAYRAEALQILSEVKSLAWVYNVEQGGSESYAMWEELGPITEEQRWRELGYSTKPETNNWNFTIYGPNTAVDGCTRGSGGCFDVRASAKPGSPADGLPNINLYINASGNVFIEDQ